MVAVMYLVSSVKTGERSIHAICTKYAEGDITHRRHCSPHPPSRLVGVSARLPEAWTQIQPKASQGAVVIQSSRNISLGYQVSSSRRDLWMDTVGNGR